MNTHGAHKKLIGTLEVSDVEIIDEHSTPFCSLLGINHLVIFVHFILPDISPHSSSYKAPNYLNYSN